jgi:hypothetical protein
MKELVAGKRFEQMVPIPTVEEMMGLLDSVTDKAAADKFDMESQYATVSDTQHTPKRTCACAHTRAHARIHTHTHQVMIYLELDEEKGKTLLKLASDQVRSCVHAGVCVCACVCVCA